MSTIDDSLRYRILQEPHTTFHVIVRTDAEANEIADQCRYRGMVVHHQFRLLPGLALSATGEALLDLAQNPHVTRIESDQPVQAL